MKRQKLILWGASALAAACLFGSGLTPAQAQPTAQTESASSPTNSAASKAKSPDTKPAVIKHPLTGAELYSMHCNRCHPERYPTERTAAQWKTIMLHMQVRANIPVEQSKLILQYLQDNSGR
jgi:cytochrome c5